MDRKDWSAIAWQWSCHHKYINGRMDHDVYMTLLSFRTQEHTSSLTHEDPSREPVYDWWRVITWPGHRPLIGLGPHSKCRQKKVSSSSTVLGDEALSDHRNCRVLTQQEHQYNYLGQNSKKKLHRHYPTITVCSLHEKWNQMQGTQSLFVSCRVAETDRHIN